MQVKQQGGVELTRELAGLLGLSVLEFVDIFGAGWHSLSEGTPSADGVDGVDMVDMGSGWYFSGAPVQLMMQIYPHGVFLARPEGFWDHDSAVMHYRERDQIFVDLRGIADRRRLRNLIDSLIRVRRTTFGYCRCCRRVTGPEQLRDAQTCHGCAVAFGISTTTEARRNGEVPEQQGRLDLP